MGSPAGSPAGGYRGGPPSAGFGGDLVAPKPVRAAVSAVRLGLPLNSFLGAVSAPSRRGVSPPSHP